MSSDRNRTSHSIYILLWTQSIRSLQEFSIRLGVSINNPSYKRYGLITRQEVIQHNTWYFKPLEPLNYKFETIFPRILPPLLALHRNRTHNLRVIVIKSVYLTSSISVSIRSILLLFLSAVTIEFKNGTNPITSRLDLIDDYATQNKLCVSQFVPFERTVEIDGEWLEIAEGWKAQGSVGRCLMRDSRSHVCKCDWLEYLQMSTISPVGTIAYIIDEEALLVRVNKGWQYIAVRILRADRHNSS